MSILDEYYGEELAVKRKELLQYARRMQQMGLVTGSFGNLSVKLGKSAALITPSGLDYQNMQEADLVAVDLTGRIFGQQKKPSSEKHLHLSLYLTRSDIGAVVHTHSVYASAFAAARLPIKPVLEDMAVLTGGQVEVAEYALLGSQQLARNAADILLERNAVLLANHGLVAVGQDLAEAFQTCEVVEKCAQVCLLSQMLGQQQVLAQADIDYMRQIYLAQYGQKQQ